MVVVVSVLFDEIKFEILDQKVKFNVQNISFILNNWIHRCYSQSFKLILFIEIKFYRYFSQLIYIYFY